VCILDKGFCKIELILSKNSTLKGKNKVLLKEAFSCAFPGAKWGKTTYYKYLPQWKSADEDIKDIFINLGSSTGAEFKVFLRALADPRHLLFPSPSPHSSPVPVEHSQLEQKAKGKEKVTISQDIPNNGNNSCEDDDDYTPSTNDEDNGELWKHHHASAQVRLTGSITRLLSCKIFSMKFSLTRSRANSSTWRRPATLLVQVNINITLVRI